MEVSSQRFTMVKIILRFYFTIKIYYYINDEMFIKYNLYVRVRVQTMCYLQITSTIRSLPCEYDFW